MARDRYRCRICGAGERLEIHHIIAVADGGTSDPSNLILLCADHHLAVERGEIAF